MSVAAEITRVATRLAYLAQQEALRAPLVRAHRVVRALTHNPVGSSRGDAVEVRRRYRELLERDLDNVERGLYPVRLLFEMPLADYARRIPRFLADLPRSALRSRRGDFQDLPGDVDLGAYPEYYRRNFHWQTDGYFSRRSAELYDVGVELLFLGAADVMRRQVVPPVRRHFDQRPANGSPRILDVACGTGSTLRQLAVAFPAARLYGLDLSPHYVAFARERLHGTDAALVADNAEAMPYRDGWFDAVVSVYLFHELPKNARRAVLREMWRVLRPGGVLVIEDSAQLSDAPEIAGALAAFGREMHEPYYAGYVKDDLATALTEIGFDVQGTEPCFVSKVVTATKPAPA
jgi:ubiquinone/menaquinone biosynthesis C-methylase UbiE